MLQSSKLSFRFKNLSEEDSNSEAQNVSENEVDKVEQKSSDIYEVYKKLLMEKIESIPVWFDYSTEKQKELISSFVVNKLQSDNILFSDVEKNDLISKLVASVTGFGPIENLVKQKNVSAIFINASSTVHIEIGGKVLNTEIKLSDLQINFILKNIENISENKPDRDKLIWNCKSENLVMSVILPPLSENGVCITIKKIFSYDMKDFLDNGFLNKDIYDFLVSALKQKKNIIISGDVNSGKTALIDNFLSNVLTNKRCLVLEEFPQMNSDDINLLKYNISALKSDYEFKTFYSELLRMQGDYLIIDSNNPMFFTPCVSAIQANQGAILSLRSASVENAISKLVNAYIYEFQCNEKTAKLRFYTNFDYLVQINRCEDGVCRITSVIELIPAKTAIQCTKLIAKWQTDHFITDVPQPLTSIRAESFFPAVPKSGSMKERFYSKSMED